jgi:uncharacterized protein YkwD
MDSAHQPFRVLAALTLAAALCACGGDGGDGTSADGASMPAADGAPASGSSGSTNSTGAAGSTGTSGAGGAANVGAGDGTTTSGSSGATGSAGTGSTAPGTTTIPAAGNLQTTTPPTSYTSGSAGAGAIASLNAARQGAGAGLLVQSTQLDDAAAAHARYLAANIGSTGHTEDSTKINYYELSPASRVAKAGFAAGASTEAISNSGTLLASDCMQPLLNSLYNAVALLGPSTHVGFGFGSNFATTPFCVSVLATPSSSLYGQVAGTGSLLTYPYGGQYEVIEAFDVNLETPRPPLTLFPNTMAGTPVIVNVRNADFVNLLAAGALDVVVNRFELTDQSGNRVPAAVLANPSLRPGAAMTLNADADLLTGAAVLIPLAPLLRAHTYTVVFSAELKAGGPALDRTWSFTTRP